MSHNLGSGLDRVYDAVTVSYWPFDASTWLLRSMISNGDRG